MGLPLLAGGDTGRAAARRKGSVVPIPGGASQRAREVVLGLGVAAKEAGTSQPQEGLDLFVRRAVAEQRFLQVGDAPIGLREALWDAQAVEEPTVDVPSRSRGDGRVAVRGQRRSFRVPIQAVRCGRQQRTRGGGEQGVSVGGELSLGIQGAHPRA
jgi:hypothetical protein